MAEKKKITRSGLAKWVVISSLDPDFSKALFADLFYLAAWESYSIWKKQPEDNKVFEWENKKLLWSEWQEWRKTQAKGTGGKTESEGNETKKNWQFLVPYFYRWNGFYDKWCKKDFFEPALFFTIGEKSFSSSDACEAYRFLNQIIVATEKPKEETKKAGKKYREINDDEIQPGADLSYGDLHARDLRNRNLKYVNLEGANLIRVNLFQANLTGANLMGADLRGAELRGAELMEADLWGANLRGANFTGANLNGANFTEADLQGANLMGAELFGAEFVKGEILNAKNWRSAIFDDGVMEKLKHLDKGRKKKSPP